MRRILKSLAIVSLVVSLAGCQAMTGKTAGQNVDDANLTASVKANLVADKASNLTRIDVDTNGGIVYLNGTVESPQQKERAEQLARQVQGVKKVVNNLQIARG
jgi:hyperosmotically inducible protein